MKRQNPAITQDYRSMTQASLEAIYSRLLAEEMRRCRHGLIAMGRVAREYPELLKALWRDPAGKADCQLRFEQEDNRL